MLKELNDKERTYVEVYLATFCFSEAYKVAFPNHNKNSVNSNAYLIAKRPHVKAEIDRRMAEIIGERQIVANKYMAKLDAIAMADIGDERVSVKEQIDAMKVLLNEMARIEAKGKPQESVIKISLED